MFWFARRYIAHLEAEVQHLREHVMYHEQRADRALADLAAVSSGRAISGPVPAVPYTAPDPTELMRQHLLNEPDMAAAGQIP